MAWNAVCHIEMAHFDGLAEFLKRGIHLADFLKTNLKKFAVICVKKRQKARFLSPRSSKIMVTKEKEKKRRKTKNEKKIGRRKKKEQWLHS